jgi:aminopeptidase-like protein
MTLDALRRSFDPAEVGAAMHALAERLYPLPRSLTGDGVRETLRIVGEQIPLTTTEVPTGTPALDWSVPREWNLRDAYIADRRGRRIVDARRLSLHVVGYSVPIRARMSLEALRPHLTTLPEHPSWVPYRTSYYREAWGFCLSEDQLHELRDDEEYEVVIDATLGDGHLTYAECVLEGDTPEEVLVSSHVCHPALANDNLSGIAVAARLAQALASVPRRYTYRFLFAPTTIGTLTWLARNEEAVARIRHGLVLSNVGDAGAPTYKNSRRETADIDRAMALVLGEDGRPHEIRPFSPWGYDERQFCSPGFDLPVGCLMRTPHGEFAEYHTSADDLAFIRPEALFDTFDRCLAAFDVLERDGVYRNLSPRGEPQFGRRGISWTSGGDGGRLSQLALLWVLNLSDGEHSLLDVAARSGLRFAEVADAAAVLREHALLAESGPL